MSSPTYYSPGLFGPSRAANVAASLGALIVGNGVYGLVRPRGALAQLFFPPPLSAADQGLVEGLMRMLAATRVVVGASTLVTWWCGSYEALGWQSIVGVFMAIVDGFVSQSVIGSGSWSHWVSVPIDLGLGLVLIQSV